MTQPCKNVSDDKEGEDNSSKLEQYKNVQSVSIGDIEIHKYFITRSQDLALSVDKTLDLEKEYNKQEKKAVLKKQQQKNKQ
jgi:hypothetical protein